MSSVIICVALVPRLLCLCMHACALSDSMAVSAVLSIFLDLSCNTSACICLPSLHHASNVSRANVMRET